jgi:hypothetical protein
MQIIDDKLQGRYGNKGVITTITPDNIMPMAFDGVQPQIIFSPLSILNRIDDEELENLIIERLKLNHIARLVDEFYHQVKAQYGLETVFLSEKKVSAMIAIEMSDRLSYVFENTLYLDDEVLFDDIMLELFSEGVEDERDIVQSMISYINIKRR